MQVNVPQRLAKYTRVLLLLGSQLRSETFYLDPGLVETCRPLHRDSSATSAAPFGLQLPKISGCIAEVDGKISEPLASPRINMKTDCKPKRLRKYHDKLETHRTSRSRVATPDWSIDLKRMVNGKGSFTVTCSLC